VAGRLQRRQGQHHGRLARLRRRRSPSPPDQRKKPIAILCTDTRVEAERSETPRGQGGNPAIVETIEATLARMRKFSEQNALNIEAESDSTRRCRFRRNQPTFCTSPPPEQSFWVNIIGRGYPPPNRTFRWCTKRTKIDPVTTFVQQRLQNGHWSEAILHLGARRAESSTRAQTMANREKRNGLLSMRHLFQSQLPLHTPTIVAGWMMPVVHVQIKQGYCLSSLARQGRSWGFPVWLASQDADKFLTEGTNETDFAQLAECGVHFSPQTLSPADQKLVLGTVIHQKFKKAEAALRLQGKFVTGMARQYHRDGGK
jgi:hypothetical protein